MKPTNERIKVACERLGRLRKNGYGQKKWPSDLDDVLVLLDAVEDKAPLTEDVEAFVAEQEEGLRTGHALFRADVVERFCAIVRAQGAELARLRIQAEGRAAVAANLEDVAREACAERDALADRLAKLEAGSK